MGAQVTGFSFQVEDEEVFQSILTTKKTIANVAIGESESLSRVNICEYGDAFMNEGFYFDAVMTLLHAHREKIRCLKLMNVSISAINFAALVRLMPNLRVLMLFAFNRSATRTSSNKLNIEIPLPAVKNLICCESGLTTDRYLEMFPANCFHSFTFRGELSLMSNFLARQRDIKILNVGSNERYKSKGTPLLADYKLSHLTVSYLKDALLADIIGSQLTALISLDVLAITLNKKQLSILARMPQLESLKVNMTGLSSAPIDFVNKNLKKLWLKLGSSLPHDLIATVQESSLQRLTIIDWTNPQDSQVAALRAKANNYRVIGTTHTFSYSN